MFCFVLFYRVKWAGCVIVICGVYACFLKFAQCDMGAERVSCLIRAFEILRP